ncbi:hypothetical protein C8C85_1560 [Flavobacterium sp. 103]|nr:hypothetical protein C8C85_1560 [Flavobacterium sp. 103]
MIKIYASDPLEIQQKKAQIISEKPEPICAFYI